MASIIPTGSTQASGLTRKGGKAIWAGRLIGTTPTQLEPLNIGFGQGNPNGTRITAAITDLGLSGEIVVNPGQSTRVVGTPTQVSTAAGNYFDTYQVVGTITAGAATTLQIVEAALFDTSAWPAFTTVATQGILSGVGTGTFTITSATGFPTGSSDYTIDSEVMTGTLAGTTVTITARGANGTTAAIHANGSNIGICSQSGTGNGGVMAAKGDFGLITLAPADTLQLTAKIQFT